MRTPRSTIGVLVRELPGRWRSGGPLQRQILPLPARDGSPKPAGRASVATAPQGSASGESVRTPQVMPLEIRDRSRATSFAARNSQAAGEYPSRSSGKSSLSQPREKHPLRRVLLFCVERSLRTPKSTIGVCISKLPSYRRSESPLLQPSSISQPAQKTQFLSTFPAPSRIWQLGEILAPRLDRIEGRKPMQAVAQISVESLVSTGILRASRSHMKQHTPPPATHAPPAQP